MDAFPVVFCFTDAFAEPSLVSIWSLITHTTLPKLKIYILVDYRLSEEPRENIKKLCDRFKSRVDLEFVEISQFYDILPMDDLERWSDEIPHYGINSIVEFRLFLPELLPNEDNCLFLDADTYVARNLDEFLTTPVGDAYVMEFAKHYRTNSDAYLKWIKENNLSNKYVNVGIGKFNLKKWRELKLYDKIIEIYKGSAIHRWEQDIFNIYFRDYIGNFELKYNSGSHIRNCEPSEEKYKQYIEDCGLEEFLEARENPAIYHFSGPYKPWIMQGDNLWKQKYEEYKKFMGEN